MKALHPAGRQRPRLKTCPCETAWECIGPLERGGRVIGVTKGQFSMLDMIRAVLRSTGPAHLRVSTWTCNIRSLEQARWLIETRQLLSLTMLTDRSFPRRHPDYAARLVEIYGDGVIKCSNIHAKIALLSNDAGWRVAVRSSMNMTGNPRSEQFDIDDDAEIHDYLADYFDAFEALAPAGASVDEAGVHSAFKQALEPRKMRIRGRSGMRRRKLRQ